MSDDEKKAVNEKRLKAAILGAFVADAASMGTHNYNDLDALGKAVPSKEEPEFKDPPAPLEYSAADYPGHYGPGMPSPHGEQLLFATEYCGKHLCVTGGHMSVRYKEFAESFGGLQDSTTKEFLELMKELDRSVELIGADNNQGKFPLLYEYSPLRQDHVNFRLLPFVSDKRFCFFLLPYYICSNLLYESNSGYLFVRR